MNCTEMGHELDQIDDIVDKVTAMIELSNDAGKKYSFSEMLRLYEVCQIERKLEKIYKELRYLYNMIDEQYEQQRKRRWQNKKTDIVKYRNEFNLTNINVMDKIEMEELFICNNPECKQGFPVVKNKPKIVKCPDCEKGYMIKKTR